MSQSPSSNRNIGSLLAVLLATSLAFGAYIWLKNQAPDRPVTDETAMPVYFTQLKGGTSITVRADRPAPEAPVALSTPYRVTYAVQELLKGPSPAEAKAGVYSEIPKGTKLISVKETKTKITVDLSPEFGGGAGAHSLIQRVAELQNTLAPLAKGRDVIITVKGQPLTLIGSDGLELPNPLIDGQAASAPAQPLETSRTSAASTSTTP